MHPCNSPGRPSSWDAPVTHARWLLCQYAAQLGAWNKRESFRTTVRTSAMVLMEHVRSRRTLLKGIVNLFEVHHIEPISTEWPTALEDILSQRRPSSRMQPGLPGAGMTVTAPEPFHPCQWPFANFATVDQASGTTGA